MMVIGLEIHVQLKTQEKIFCRCPTNYRMAEANENICPICTGQPGCKPMAVNSKALENAIKIALALQCELKRNIFIQRKHYFYPDLPSGYQRTSKPIGVNGKLGDIRIREIHIEEDPGRYELKKGIVDYNRSGIPLIEIVTEPNIKSPEEARAFLEELAVILGYLDAGRDDPGSSRIDANLSIDNGARVEVKNINSFKGVYTALMYEQVRQQNMLRRGAEVIRETRHFDEASGTTIGLRKKEAEEDYRYFPDPDIPPILITREMIDDIKRSIPELPRQKSNRFVSEYRIKPDDAWILVSEQEIACLFEKMANEFKGREQKIASWIRGPLKKQLNYRNLTFKESGLTQESLSNLFSEFSKGLITDRGMERCLIEMLDKKLSFSDAVIKLGLSKIQDYSKLEEIVDEELRNNPKPIEDYKKGNEKALNFVIGQIVKKSKGMVDSKEAKDIILKKLKNI
ncbi:MAG: Asp-tRNA(Asn)/Glu-tRNA(Gln) amidotransferase subunit GatB [Candidatus Micrarchaeia archaeon]